jgi:hypothetical protein
MSARSARRTSSKDRHTPGDGSARVPLWRDVREVEASLRPVVPPRTFERAPVPWWHLAVGTAAVGGMSLVASIVVYRRSLVIARLQRPRQLQGPPIASLRAFARPRVVAAAWQPAATALGVGVAVWLVALAHPRWRGTMLRWGWLAGMAGVAGYVLLTLRMMPLPR